jgi:hypothetical protein
MVHALEEVHRVLRPNGVLIDLRPALRRRRVGVYDGSQVQWLGRTHEQFDEDRAANRAVAEVLRAGLFRRKSLTSFDLDRVMQTAEDFEDWLADFVGEEQALLHERLMRRLKKALREGGRKHIIIRGPLRLAVLLKQAE